MNFILRCVTPNGPVLAGCGGAVAAVCRGVDSGPGVSEHERRAIFDEFRATMRAAPWPGLAIAERIARLLNSCSCAAGLGAAACSRLPCRVPAGGVAIPRTTVIA